MTRKAEEPRTTMKVPISFRERVRKISEKNKTTMMEYLISIVPKDQP